MVASSNLVARFKFHTYNLKRCWSRGFGPVPSKHERRIRVSHIALSFSFILWYTNCDNKTNERCSASMTSFQVVRASWTLASRSNLSPLMHLKFIWLNNSLVMNRQRVQIPSGAPNFLNYNCLWYTKKV